MLATLDEKEIGSALANLETLIKYMKKKKLDQAVLDLEEDEEEQEDDEHEEEEDEDEDEDGDGKIAADFTYNSDSEEPNQPRKTPPPPPSKKPNKMIQENSTPIQSKDKFVSKRKSPVFEKSLNSNNKKTKTLNQPTKNIFGK